ncbi:hypothetical protein ACCC88_19655 [Sphingomonas sp. Sphisp140]|uniref:hypothetical protein n=1 Tax=unclassified Sphingomonas TaxID=196159 RepID=UPI0039AF6EE0
MDLLLGGFDLLLLGLGANPLIWFAFVLVGLGGALGLTMLRRRGLRLGLLLLWIPLPLLAGIAFAAPCMLSSHDAPGACYGEGMALVMSMAVALVWAAGSVIGMIMGIRRRAGDRVETRRGF